jgi:hypothetical protein
MGLVWLRVTLTEGGRPRASRGHTQVHVQPQRLSDEPEHTAKIQQTKNISIAQCCGDHNGEGSAPGELLQAFS